MDLENGVRPHYYRDVAGKLLEVVKSAVRRFDEERCFQLAGSLTYTTLLALVPLITVALALSTTFPVFREWTAHLDVWFEKNVLPEQISGSVAGYVSQFATAAARLTAIGVIFLAVTAVMLMLTIDSGLSQIFRVNRPRPLAQQVLIYWAVLTLGPMLMSASISMTSVLLSPSLGAAKDLAPLHFVLLRSVPFLLTAVAYTLVYLLVPNRKIHFRHALAGGLVAATLFEAMQRVFAIYIENFPTYRQVYGTFAAVPIFLVWLYLCWVVVLFGAALTAILPKPLSAAWRGRPAGQQFYEGLEILGALADTQRHGRTLPLAELVDKIDLAPDQCERLLERMERLGWIAHASGHAWVLARGAESLTVADVYKAFVMESESLHTDAGAEMRALHELLAAPRAGLEASMQMSVRDLYSEPPSAEEPLRRNRVLEIVSAKEQK
jgi:membrane protein